MGQCGPIGTSTLRNRHRDHGVTLQSSPMNTTLSRHRPMRAARRLAKTPYAATNTSSNGARRPAAASRDRGRLLVRASLPQWPTPSVVAVARTLPWPGDTVRAHLKGAQAALDSGAERCSWPSATRTQPATCARHRRCSCRDRRIARCATRRSRCLVESAPRLLLQSGSFDEPCCAWGGSCRRPDRVGWPNRGLCRSGR